LAQLGLIVVRPVILGQEYGLVGQKMSSPRSRVFSYCGAHVDLHTECTGEKAQKLQTQIDDNTHTNKGCIPGILALFNKMTTSHKIASLKTTDLAKLDNFPIQFDDCANEIFEDIESRS
jgi:hypothetical protein